MIAYAGTVEGKTRVCFVHILQQNAPRAVPGCVSTSYLSKGEEKRGKDGKRRPGMVECACNPSTQEPEAGAWKV